MTYLTAIAIALLLAILVLSSYVDRLYSESGKFLSLKFQENIDIWEKEVEPRLGMARGRIALSAAVWTRLSLAILALYFGALLFVGASANHPTGAEIAQAVLGAILVIVLFNQFLPFVFFTRTRGEWIVRLRPVLAVLFYAVLPITLLVAFLLSVAELAEPPAGRTRKSSTKPRPSMRSSKPVQEEGILRESDRDLVRSAVEFGDKVVRDVMTPRPSIFAVPGEMTLADFLIQLEECPYSRVPVFTARSITSLALPSLTTCSTLPTTLPASSRCRASSLRLPLFRKPNG